MKKKKYSKLKNTKVRELDSEVQDQRDILAIVEGCFGVPVKRSGRFINVNHPSDDATKEELEAIKRSGVSRRWKTGNGLRSCVIKR